MKYIKKCFLLIVAIFTSVACLFCIACCIEAGKNMDLQEGKVLVLAFYLLIAVGFGLISFICFKSLFQKQKVQQVHKQSRTLPGKHQAGLPLAQDAYCMILMEDDCFKISGSGNEFELKKAKMTELTVKTDAEIQRQYVSSIGGAVAGGMIFGPLGAIVGGRAKEKKTTLVTHYLIFTYRSNDEVNYISFEIYRGYLSKAQKWCKEFHNRMAGNSNSSIEL